MREGTGMTFKPGDRVRVRAHLGRPARYGTIVSCAAGRVSYEITLDETAGRSWYNPFEIEIDAVGPSNLRVDDAAIARALEVFGRLEHISRAEAMREALAAALNSTDRDDTEAPET